jgi:hypothetical protein
MSDPNDTNPVTQIKEEKKERKSNPFGGLTRGWRAAAVWVSLPVLGFMASVVWGKVLEYEKEIGKLQLDIERLKDTNAQWSALTSHENSIREMVPQMKVVMWLLEHGKLAEVTKPTDKPLVAPKFDGVSLDEFKKTHEEKASLMMPQILLQKK